MITEYFSLVESVVRFVTQITDRLWKGWIGIFSLSFLPKKIEIPGYKPFYTSYSNYYQSQEITRIFQARFTNGEELNQNDRDYILKHFGPQKGKGYLESNYKDVRVNLTYFKRR